MARSHPKSTQGGQAYPLHLRRKIKAEYTLELLDSFQKPFEHGSVDPGEVLWVYMVVDLYSQHSIYLAGTRMDYLYLSIMYPVPANL